MCTCTKDTAVRHRKLILEVHGVKMVRRLTLKQWAKIVESSRHVLEKAIKSGGTTINDFVNESGKSGYFQLELQTYRKKGRPCSCCATPIA